MITENQVTEILSNELPEINNELIKLSNSKNIYKTMQCFVDFTKELVKRRNLAAVKNCFNLAERMLEEGNNSVKNAVENVYVYSIAPILYLTTPINNEMNAIFNSSLKKEYYGQVYASGI